MAPDQYVAFIGTLLGGLGIGSLITTVITKWLEGRSERKRWLRDKKWSATSSLFGASESFKHSFRKCLR